MTAPIVLRSAGAEDAEGIAAVHHAASRQGLAEVLPKGVVDGFTSDQRRALWTGLFGTAHGRPSVEVAARGADVLGFAWWRRLAAAVYDAEVITLHVRPDAQRRGLGRRLMVRTKGRMAEAGAESCYLWVFEANAGARRFYEALGGRPVDRDRECYGGHSLPIVAYAWKPLEALGAAEDGA
jgi:ribosomal protein S18 acetylase RimI-like enzyme